MKEDVILKELETLSPSTYIKHLYMNGRLSLDKPIRDQASRLFENVFRYRRTEIFISTETGLTLELAERVFFGEWFMARNPKPRYQAYTNIRVLNWALETNRLLPMDQVIRGAWRAIRTLVDNWKTFERRSLDGLESNFQVAFDADSVGRRLEKLSTLENWIPREETTQLHDRDPGRPGTWIDYATDPSRTMALVELTCPVPGRG